MNFFCLGHFSVNLFYLRRFYLFVEFIVSSFKLRIYSFFSCCFFILMLHSFLFFVLLNIQNLFGNIFFQRLYIIILGFILALCPNVSAVFLVFRSLFCWNTALRYFFQFSLPFSRITLLIFRFFAWYLILRKQLIDIEIHVNMFYLDLGYLIKVSTQLLVLYHSVPIKHFIIYRKYVYR